MAASEADRPNEATAFGRAVVNILADYSEETLRLHDAQRAVLNILEDSQDERARLNEVRSAVVNILADFTDEKAELARTQRAVTNILEDSATEKLRLSETQRAVTNILEDSAAEQLRLEATQRAVTNILEDVAAEKLQLGDTQRAVTNILEDFATEKQQLQATQRAVLNILEDVDTERNERKKAEERVRALNDNLEARVAERTAALTASNAELESFAYSVSHDLRSPLRAIDGFSQVLLEDHHDALDESGKDALRRVRAATQRMGHLIDDLLKLSRITRKPIEVGPVDLSAIAARVVAELQTADPDRRVRVAIARPVTGIGDQQLLDTVIENLLSNAWKFTAKTPDAAIEFSATERDGDLVCCVRDNGAGFDMGYAHNLFLPFQRLHHPSEFPGNGVGLASVKRIITRLGGRVWAEGAVNKGAAFYFTLRPTPLVSTGTAG